MLSIEVPPRLKNRTRPSNHPFRVFTETRGFVTANASCIAKKIAAAGVHLCAMNFADDGLYLGHPYSERVAPTLAAFD
jgi:hypothetical protein